MKKFKWIFWYAILLHLVWGVILVISPIPIRTVGLSPYMDNIPYQIWGFAFIIISVMTLFEMTYKLVYGFIWILLQQVLLIISSGTALMCIINSSYADGVIRSRLFIMSDQIPAIIVTIIHTCGIIETYGRKSKQR